jgi:hypothetical protein
MYNVGELYSTKITLRVIIKPQPGLRLLYEDRLTKHLEKIIGTFFQLSYGKGLESLTYRTVSTVICPNSRQLGLRTSPGVSAKHGTHFCVEREESEPLQV